MAADLAFKPISELSAAIRAGDTSPVALAEAQLARIEQHGRKLHAFVEVYADDTRLAAEAADKAIRSGHAVGPLHGIPIAVKDIVDIEGRICTGGSKAWIDRASPTTATLVQRLIAAGMIVIGKTHTVEFAMGGWGTNQHMGTPWNPWDADVARTPGGSSAGSGVAVAAGLASAGIGTDTGGSVRLPASWCGIVGLKVSVGRISTSGVLPLSHTLDTPGPMTRTVEDAALLYTVLQGPDPDEPKTLGLPYTDPLPGLKRGVAGMRIGVLPPSERGRIDADVLAAYDATIATYERLGARIVELALPQPLVTLGETTGRIIGAEGYFHVGHMVDDMNLPIDEAVRPRIWIGKDMSARDYLATLAEQQAVKRAFDAALGEVDAWITPTTLTPAVPVADVDQTRTPAYFTRVVNLLERCACALPNGLSASGLPTSFQVVCPAYEEALALRVAWAFEQAGEWRNMVPPAFA
jgi:aspartyl-tRNA(Asn)/glutamyl-tRNA(Gln) amidotransferase subunit A